MSERLTDEELAEAFGYATNSLRLTAALSELRDRRAADLTAEEVEALRFARDVVWTERGDNPDIRNIVDAVRDVIDRLLAANGGGR